MKRKLGLQIKRLLNHFGYDIKYYRPFYEATVAQLDIQTILDIGANDGHYAKRMTGLFPHATVYAFEPLADCFSRIEILSKTHPHIKPLNTALGETEATLTMQRSSFHPSSSLLKMSENHKAIYPKSAKITEETIHVQRLDDIAKNIEIKEPFFVKIDVQGYEDKVIAGGKDTIKKASFIVAETAYLQLYEGQPLFNDIQNLLHSLGFSYYGAVERHYDKKGLPLYEDSAFIRSDLLSQPQ